MSRRIRFSVGPVRSVAYTDVAYVNDGEDPGDEIAQSILGTLSTDVMVTIAGETRHLAAWLDPEHWSDNYAPETVEALLAAAEEPES